MARLPEPTCQLDAVATGAATERRTPPVPVVAEIDCHLTVARRAGAWPEPSCPDHAPRCLLLSDAVDQAHDTVLGLLNFPKLEHTAAFRRRKERLAIAGDQRMNR